VQPESCKRMAPDECARGKRIAKGRRFDPSPGMKEV
jgi:hypothetical protein